jgi:hypothetical protein
MAGESMRLRKNSCGVVFIFAVPVAVAVFALVILFDTGLSFANSKANSKKCEPIVKKFETAFAELRNCLDSSTEVKPCEPKLARMTKAAKEVHACLPPVPSKKGSGGSWDIHKNLEFISDCENEGKAWLEDKLYDCLGDWNFSAHQTFQLKLPNDDCSALASSFIARKKSYHACIDSKYPGHEKPKLKAEF